MFETRCSFHFNDPELGPPAPPPTHPLFSLSCGLQRASMLSGNQWPHRNISHFLVWSSLPIVLLFSIPSYFLTNKPFASLGRMKLCHKRLSLATIPLRDISLSVLMLHCLTNPLCMFWTSVYVNSYNCPIEQIPASLDVITRKSKKIALWATA